MLDGIRLRKMPKKDIYRGKEWKELDPLRRGLILLVSEGVKPGATFRSKYRVELERVLEKLQLPYLSPAWDEDRYIYTVARDDKIILEYFGWLLNKDLTPKQFHRANGFFYGIPECCIDEFVGTSLLSEKDTRRRVGFDDLLKEYEVVNGKYPEELDYRVPGVTPCEVDCDNMLKLCRTYKDVLLRYDNDAAEELRLFNKRGYRIVR